jgi:hypothetical protein
LRLQSNAPQRAVAGFLAESLRKQDAFLLHFSWTVVSHTQQPHELASVYVVKLLPAHIWLQIPDWLHFQIGRLALYCQIH